MYYYLIAPLSVVRSDEVAFTYHNKNPLAVGTIVRIGVGKKELNGVIISATKKPLFATKAIAAELVQKPLPKPLLLLAQWLSEYYATHLALTLQTILPAGLQKQRREASVTSNPPKRNRTTIVLNHEQAHATKIITEHQSATILLHGVTGSGKTQVYIEAAKHELRHGKSSIILVPEIALTPQLVAEFNNHFGNVVVTHSHMTEPERHKTWLGVLNNDQPLVVIGARSALFMPVEKLGLVVIDEAHEPSYKQDQSPRYSALRAASILAQLHKAKLVLGSATPAITDYYLAEKTKSPVLTLTKPAIISQLPTIELIDSRNKDFFREHRFLSDALLESMRQALHDRQQVLLFHNRRGTAPTTLCSNCGWSALCGYCFVPLTLHADQHKLLCHICGRSQPVPPSCPACSGPSIVFRGIGTKLIEDEVRKLFPKANIARFDADNSGVDTLEKRYQEIYDGNIHIMIGTQILAKGLDVPNLSVVGVIQADNGLHLPDYQAEERVFQLLYQVAGRVGRHEHQGRVVVQTYTPDHPTIQLALQRDYQQFYQQQLKERQTAGLPPFTYLLKLTTSHKTEQGAVRAAQALARKLRASRPQLVILGPTPAFYERLHGHYRWQLLLKGKKRSELVAIARHIPSGWQFDLDPINLL